MSAVAARSATAVARTAGRRFASTAAHPPLNPVRNALGLGTVLRDVKSAVPEQQKFFSTTEHFTFYKKDTDKFVLTWVFGLTGLGVLIAVKG